MHTELCEHCGHVYGVGFDYRCPHEPVGNVAMLDDTLTGGARWMHNLGPEPVWIEKRSELERVMAERGLEFAERKAYCRDDKSPYATRTRLRPGQRDPFIHPVK